MATEIIALTDAKLKALKPQVKDYEIRDQRTAGLRVRVRKSGSISFRWTAKAPDGKNVVKTLGSYPQISLSEARKRISELKTHHAAVLAGDALPDEQRLNTVEALADTFYNRRIKTQRKRPEEVLSVLKHHILPAIGNRDLSTITTATCRTVIERVVDAGTPSRAGKVLAILKQMLDFAASRGDILVNPAQPLKAENLGVVANVKNRTLDADEIKALFTALDEHKRLAVTTKVAIKLLLLTGVRTGELIKAEWDNVDLDKAQWTIPPHDQKLTKKQEQTAKPFVVPLSSQSVELLNDLKTMTGHSKFVFASDSTSGRLDDKALGHAVRRMFDSKKLTGEKFSPHDLRRTHRTLLGELKVAPHIAERCLNHSLGRIVQTYDTGDYLDERREAQQQLADRVDIYLGKQDNVVALSNTQQAVSGGIR